MLSPRNVRFLVALFTLLGLLWLLVHHSDDVLAGVPSLSNLRSGQQPQAAPAPAPAPVSPKQPERKPEAETPKQPERKPEAKPDAKPGAGAETPKLPERKPDADAETKPKEKPYGKPKTTTGKVEDKCVKYVVMVDAGSTGSRVHVYSFDTCQSPPALLNEEFKMLKPGLSLFDTDAAGAAQSLDPLLELAVALVPEAKRECTPIAVKATAGLRLLGTEKSDKILTAVREHLDLKYPFPVVPGDGVLIMLGDQEGVYAWITTNFLLGNIGGKEKLSTAAVFDLGGGSTQIVFAPSFKNGEKMVEGEHKYNVEFGGELFELYQFSHLGYGLMKGRDKVNSVIVEEALAKKTLTAESKVDKATAKTAKGSVTLTNVCIAPGHSAKDVAVTLDNGDIYVVNFEGADAAAGTQCRALTELILNKDAACTAKPCLFNGVHQPLLSHTFERLLDMFVFLYFYDRTNPLGFPLKFTLGELKDLAKVVCSGSSMWELILNADAIKELTAEPQWCLDLTFMVSLLHTGYDIPLDRELKTAKTIDNNELGWCLGASLPLLDQKGSGWTCKGDLPASKAKVPAGAADISEQEAKNSKDEVAGIAGAQADADAKKVGHEL